MLSSPPSIYGAEVSAEWKRSRDGDVIMTLKMPYDTVDTEVTEVHKNTKRPLWNPDGSLISSTWRKIWSYHHVPYLMTKDKLRRLRQEKTHRRISLHMTARRQARFGDKPWSPRPYRRQDSPPPFGLDTRGLSRRQFRSNKARHGSVTRKDRSPRRRTRKMSSVDSWSKQIILASSGEDTPHRYS